MAAQQLILSLFLVHPQSVESLILSAIVISLTAKTLSRKMLTSNTEPGNVKVLSLSFLFLSLPFSYHDCVIRNMRKMCAFPGRHTYLELHDKLLFQH